MTKKVIRFYFLQKGVRNPVPPCFWKGRQDYLMKTVMTALLHCYPDSSYLSGCLLFLLSWLLGLVSALNSSMHHSLICSSMPCRFFSSFIYSSPFTTAFFADILQICISTLTSFLTSGLNFRHVPNQTLDPSQPGSGPCTCFPASAMLEAPD